MSVRAVPLKQDYPTLENQPENLIIEALSLTSMDDSSIGMPRIGEPNNLYPQLVRKGH